MPPDDGLNVVAYKLQKLKGQRNNYEFIEAIRSKIRRSVKKRRSGSPNSRGTDWIYYKNVGAELLKQGRLIELRQ